MLLRSADGSELELGTAGYEFPRGGLGEEDDNWLRIRVRVGSPRGSWPGTPEGDPQGQSSCPDSS